MTQQKVELIDTMGDDLRVVNAARVSFDKESGWLSEDCLKYADDRLLRYLAKHKHFTPFTHCQITLRETVPIFVARQRFKHQIGFSYNEVSRRYVSDTPEFYVPESWRKAAANVKQGSSEEPAELQNFTEGWLEIFAQDALCLYQTLLKEGVCPEQARMVLPQSMMTSYYVTGSLAAFARAYGLRADPHAQKEIRDLAAHWDRIIRPLFPQSWSALVD